MTYPATVLPGTLTVENGGVLADGTDQYVGPITVAGGAGVGKVTINNGTFKTGGTARAFNQAGTDLGPVSVTVDTSDDKSLDFTAPTNTVRLVITNAVVNLPSSATSITYSLAAVGGSGPITSTGTLGSGNTRTQTDIQRADVAGLVVTYRTSAATDSRIAGVDRYETAARLAAAALGGSPQTPKGKVDNVVIASGENYADALSAGYLAATQKASLILTQRGELSLAAQSFLRNYGAKRVIIVGGPAAVSPAVEAKLRELPAYDVRVATTSDSVTEETTYTQNLGTATISENAQADKTADFDPKSAKEQPQAGYQGAEEVTVTRSANPAVVNVATGSTGFVASTSPASPAQNAGFTLILTRQGKSFEVDVPANVTAATNQKITFNATYSTQTVKKPTTGSGTADTVTGDDRAVVATTSNLQVVRLQGENRFVTNRNVNEWALRNSTTSIGSTQPVSGQASKRTAIVVNGLTPWDALTSGVLVGSTDTSGGGSPVAANRPKPVILTMGNSLEGQAKGQLSSLDVQHAILVGGGAVLPEGIEAELKERGVSSARLAGANRWETAKAVGDFVFRSDAGSTKNTNPGFGFGANSPYLANGGVVKGVPDSIKWADALAVGPVASKFSRVITLTDSANLPDATKAFFQANANRLKSVIPVGGVNVVSNQVVAAANALAHAR